MVKVFLPTCSACKVFHPLEVELAASYPQVGFLSVDYMECWPGLLQFNITVVPVCIFCYEGKDIHRVLTIKKDVAEQGIVRAQEIVLEIEAARANATETRWQLKDKVIKC